MSTSPPAPPRRAPGLLLCLVIGGAAWLLGRAWPVVGAAVFALVIGIAANNLFRLPASLRPGAQFAAKKVLQYAIIALGGSLSLAQVAEAGRQSLAVMLCTLALGLTAALVLGRLLRVQRNLTALVGVGTAICGGSAIAAVAPILDADDGEVAFSISTVFLFNLAAVLIFPAAGHALGLSQHGFGIWAGTGINDTSSVVAASAAYGAEALQVATVTKLARTLMIVPVAFAILLLVARSREASGGHLRKVMPWFIFGFLALALVNSSGLLGPSFPHWAGLAGKFLIAVALAGVGLGTDLRRLAATGARPILLGLLVWAAVALGSLALQFGLTGQV
ncbi:MAG TPA: putative sulfate exporter family transporter [Armatimonadetes bacterium]|nr:putative sulfate exporter family transporter [Armatimonadota bacterium]